MKTLSIQVTQADIDGASKGLDQCPVANAARRVLGCKTIVGLDSIYPTSVGKVIGMPPEARQFVRDFDRDRPVSPFVFEVEVQEGALS